MKKIGTGTKSNNFSMTDEDRRIIDDAAAEWGCGSSEALRRILDEWFLWRKFGNAIATKRAAFYDNKPTK